MRTTIYLFVLTLLGVWLRPLPAGADELEAAKEAFQKGRQAYYEGRYEDSISHYQNAMSFKYSPKLNYNIGLAFDKIGQSQNAKNAFLRYLQEEPNAANGEEVRQRIEAIDQQLKKVDAQTTPPPTAQPLVPPKPLVGGLLGVRGRFVTIDFYSVPPQAELFIGGQSMGITPMRLNLGLGATYALTVEKPGYRTLARQLQVKGRERVDFLLAVTPEGRTADMTRTEWIGLEPVLGAAPTASSLSVGLNLEIITLKWARVCWTLGELHLIAGGLSTIGIGTRPSFPLFFGEQGQHQIRTSLGIHLAAMRIEYTRATNTGTNSEDGGALVLSPAIEYHYQFKTRFFIGVGFKALWYAVGPSEHPALLLFTIPMGWSSLN